MVAKNDDKTLKNSPQLLRVRDIILNYGWNSTSYQIINPGISYWFSDRGDAVVGFVSCAGVRVVTGSSVCGEIRLVEIAAEFESDAARLNERVCYLAAESRLEAIYKNFPKYTEVLL